MKWWMLVNSRGRPDALLTFAAGAVVTVLLKTLLNGVVVGAVHFGTIDASLAGALLASTLGAYTWKRTSADRGTGTTLTESSSSSVTTRGYVLPGLIVLVALGFGIYLYAMAHRGIP